MIESLLRAMAIYIATLFNTIASYLATYCMHKNVSIMLYTKLIRLTPQCYALTSVVDHTAADIINCRAIPLTTYIII